MPWLRIAAVEDCLPGKCLETVAGNNVVALFNVDGKFHALDGVCPHQGGPLGQGSLSDCIVTCPWHGWQFDVKTGANQINRNITQPRFETKIEDSAVWVNVPDS